MSTNKAVMYRNPMAKGEYRNHPCICGGGKKMKQCHGREAHITQDQYAEIMRLGDDHNKRAMEFHQAIIEQEAEIRLKNRSKENETN